jgi:hypothetical protein
VARPQCGVRNGAAEAAADARNEESPGVLHASILEIEGARSQSQSYVWLAYFYEVQPLSVTFCQG